MLQMQSCGRDVARMNPFAYAATGLGWLGRQGTRAVALPFLIAIPLAPLVPSAKPYLPETIFLLLVLSFLRVRPQALHGHFARPLVFAASSGSFSCSRRRLAWLSWRSVCIRRRLAFSLASFFRRWRRPSWSRRRSPRSLDWTPRWHWRP